jgi:hypothetical protein
MGEGKTVRTKHQEKFGICLRTWVILAIIIGCLCGVWALFSHVYHHTTILYSMKSSPIDYKNEQDRMVVTDQELKAIRKKTLAMKGVRDFTIHREEGGLYGELVVPSKKRAKAIAEVVFSRMVAETTHTVDLFVELDDKDKTILIQAFKPDGEDHEFKWDILY